MSFTLIGKHEKDSRNNRDGFVTAMLDLMEKDSKVMHVDCDLENCINTGKLAKAFPEQTVNAGIAEANALGVAAGLAATGAALGNKLDGRDSHVFVFVGDGECDEGQVWEAAQFAAHYKLDNLICFVDDNKYQLDGAVDKVMSHGKGIGAKFDAFGWNVIELQDGNDVEQIYDAVQLAYDTKGVPTCIVLNTVKGLGATFAEGTGAHSSQPSKEQWDEAIAAAEKKLAEIKAQ